MSHISTNIQKADGSKIEWDLGVHGVQHPNYVCTKLSFKTAPPMIALIKNSNMFLKDRPLLFMYSTCAIDSPGHNQKLFLLIYMWLQFNFTRPRMHYGSFRQNLSKNTQKCYFCMDFTFLVPKALTCIKEHMKIEKGR